MIMAGRGRRLEGNSEEPNTVGFRKIPAESTPADLPLLINKIIEINPSNINHNQLLNVHTLFKQLFTSKESMRDVLSNLHTKALADAEFGEKTILALEQISHLEVDGALVRGELLSFIQNDFKTKETTSQSDQKAFLNSVLLLGNVYHRFKVCGEPIAVLGIALLEYFDLLIKGKEEQLKVLTKQILINGINLSQVKNFEVLIKNLRTTLLNTNENSSSRCWILLAIDFISNNLKPLKGVVRDFYVENLGEEYIKLESCIPVENEPIQSPVPQNNLKSPDSTSSGSKNFSFSSNNTDTFNKDLSKKFSNMNVKTGSGSKDKNQSFKTNKKDGWKSRSDERGISGHDDRFDKDENFYGAQKPRQPKPVNPKKKFNDAKGNRKGDDDSKKDLYKSEAEQETVEH